MGWYLDGQAVASFLGRATAPHDDDAAEIVEAFVRSYVRGSGFPVDEYQRPPDDLVAVMVTAAARLASNPAQLEQERAGDYYAVGGFHGFTLAEQAVLHRYRRRTA